MAASQVLKEAYLLLLFGQLDIRFDRFFALLHGDVHYFGAAYWLALRAENVLAACILSASASPTSQQCSAPRCQALLGLVG